jgi:hypothetical protein
MADDSKQSLISSITAVSTTVAATLLVGFFGSFKDMAVQAPVIAAHMVVTSSKLAQIEGKQTDQSMLLAGLVKDYTSREVLRMELEKLEAKVRELQMQQALLNQRQASPKR